MEFSKVRAVEVWPTPLGRFLPALDSRVGVIAAAIVGATWVVLGALAIGTETRGA